MTDDIARPAEGDVVELILDDHRRFEELLRALRDETSDRQTLRQQMSRLLVAHGEAEESQVYPQLQGKHAIDEEEAEHGVLEHDEGYETLLPLLEADAVSSEEFSQAIHEFSETLLHHLDEEERDILNPARVDVSDHQREVLGANWCRERNRLLDDPDSGTLTDVRRLVEVAEQRQRG
ncbi:MAG: hemerythrin domain-containing protein [Nocardioidaceae bacterium]